MKHFVLAFWALPLSSLVATPAAFSASVKKKSTKRRLVIIDEGSNDSVEKGSKVCFYNKSDKKVACGRVVKVRSSSSYVKLGKKSIRRVRTGYEARLPSASSMAADSGSFMSKSSDGHAGKWSFSAGYIFTLIPSTQFNPPSRAADNTWVATELGLADKTTAIGFGGEVTYKLSPSMAIAVGGRFKSLDLRSSQSDYENSRDPYVLSETKGSQIGGWGDFYFYKLNLFSSLIANIGVGADVDMSSIDFQSIVLAEENTSAIPAEPNLVVGNASTIVLSARFPVAISYQLSKTLSLTSKFTLMFAVAEFGQAFDITDGSEGESTAENYAEAFDLGPAGLAFEITPIQINYAF